jgi:hypothetical protein
MSIMSLVPRFKRFMIALAVVLVLIGIVVSTFVFTEPTRTRRQRLRSAFNLPALRRLTTNLAPYVFIRKQKRL